jgi:hypothetical protein
MLPKAAQDALATHIDRTWARRECVQCGMNNWATHGYITLTIADTLGSAVGASILPTAAAVCQVCGNTVLINLVVAGVPLPATTTKSGAPPGWPGKSWPPSG